MIKFNELPKENKKQLLPAGWYKATIKKAYMKQPNDVTNPEYLNLVLSVVSEDGKNSGIVYDRIIDNPNDAFQYKIGRFVYCLDLHKELEACELEDLTKVVVGKELMVEIIVKEDEKYGNKNEVALFDAVIYYPISEIGTVWKSKADEAINASDAEDADTSVQEDEKTTEDSGLFD